MHDLHCRYQSSQKRGETFIALAKGLGISVSGLKRWARRGLIPGASNERKKWVLHGPLTPRRIAKIRHSLQLKPKIHATRSAKKAGTYIKPTGHTDLKKHLSALARVIAAQESFIESIPWIPSNIAGNAKVVAGNRFALLVDETWKCLILFNPEKELGDHGFDSVKLEIVMLKTIYTIEELETDGVDFWEAWPFYLELMVDHFRREAEGDEQPLSLVRKNPFSFKDNFARRRFLDWISQPQGQALFQEYVNVTRVSLSPLHRLFFDFYAHSNLHPPDSSHLERSLGTMAEPWKKFKTIYDVINSPKYDSFDESLREYYSERFACTIKEINDYAQRFLFDLGIATDPDDYVTREEFESARAVIIRILETFSLDVLEGFAKKHSLSLEKARYFIVSNCSKEFAQTIAPDFYMSAD